jgi:hypothetical protein
VRGTCGSVGRTGVLPFVEDGGLNTHSLTVTHSLTPTHSLTHTHSLTLTHSLSLAHSHSLSLTYSHFHSYSLSLAHSFAHSLSLTLTHSFTYFSLSHACTHILAHPLTRTLGPKDARSPTFDQSIPPLIHAPHKHTQSHLLTPHKHTQSHLLTPHPSTLQFVPLLLLHHFLAFFTNLIS